MATLTPEEISQILEEFFKTVGTRQYIGARYVPIFGRKDESSIDWDNTKPYEPLTIVLYQGNSYTSRQYVPAGVPITDQEFWALTGNYNAQIEAYRHEVQTLSDAFDDVVATATNARELAQDTADALADYQTATDGQLAGTSASGLLTMIEADGTRLDGIDGQLAGTSPSGLKTLITDGLDAVDNEIEDIKTDVSHVKHSNSYSKLIKPQYVGDIIRNKGIQGLAVKGDDFYLAIYAEGIGTQIVQCNRVSNNVVRAVDYNPESHMNSMAYDSVRNCIWAGAARKYTLDLQSYTAPSFSVNGVSCVSFDFVTKTFWAFVGLSSDTTQAVYKMEQDESDLTYFCTIDNIKGRQDMCVYDDVMMINSTRGWIDVCAIDRANSTIERISSYTVDHKDAAEKFVLGEPEGMAFNEDGYFFMGFRTELGQSVSNQTGQDNFITTIGYGGKLYPNTPSILLMRNHEQLHLDTDRKGDFTLGIQYLRSLSQVGALYNLDYVQEIVYDTDFDDNNYMVRIENGNLLIANVGHNVSFRGITKLGGALTINNSGTITCSTHLVNALNTCSQVVIRNGGTIHNNTNKLVSYGAAPIVVLVTAVGTIDNPVVGDNYATITANNTYVIGAKSGTF